LHRAFRAYCRVQHPKRNRASFPRRVKLLGNDSAVDDLVKGIPAFWTDKSIASAGDQIFKAFLMVCAFALIAYDQ
jgi:hypothetical protein